MSATSADDASSDEEDTVDDLQVSGSSSDEGSGSDGDGSGSDGDEGSSDGGEELLAPDDVLTPLPDGGGSPGPGGALAAFTAPAAGPGPGAGKPRLSLDQFAHGDAILSAIVARRDRQPDELDPTGGAGGGKGAGGKGWEAARAAAKRPSSKKGSLKRLGFLRVMRKKLEKQLAADPQDGTVWERLGYVLHEQPVQRFVSRSIFTHWGLRVGAQTRTGTLSSLGSDLSAFVFRES